MIPILTPMASLVTGIITGIGGLFLLYLILVFLPLIIQIMLSTIVSSIESAFRINIRPFVDVFLLPGSLLRMTFVWLILTRYGFEYRVAFNPPRIGESATNISSGFNYRGLSIYAGLSKRGMERIQKGEFSSMKIAFLTSLASYAIMPIVVLLMVLAENILYGMYFLLPSHLVVPLFIGFVVSLTFGGLPVPEESMTILYVFLMAKPHLILSSFLLFLGLLILSPYIGVAISMILGMGVMVTNILIDRFYTPEYEKIKLDEQLMGLISSEDDF